MIDIIIPTYNNPEDLDKALSSLYAQTSTNFNVVVVDDASLKDYSVIIKNYQDKFNLKYIKNPNNLGPGLSRQVGLDNSKGDYFIFLDSDDRLLPYAVQLINDLIEKNKYPDLIISPFYTQVFEEHKELFNRNSSILISQDINKIVAWHHGKVYCRSSVERYGIKVPKKYSYITDDCYYNTLCTELFDNQVVASLPYYLWVQNENSITHTRNLDIRTKQNQIAKSLLDASKYVLQYQNKLSRVKLLLMQIVEAKNQNKPLVDNDIAIEIEDFLIKNNL